MLKTKRILLSTVIGASTLAMLAAAPAMAQSADSNNLVPEVITTVWVENDKECASVSINGNDVITYESAQGSTEAEAKAEELSTKLQSLLRSKSFSSDELLPAVEGGLASINVGDKSLLKFEVPTGSDKSDESVMKPCFKLVNALREAAGQEQLPSSFLSIASTFAEDASFDSAKASSCFSGKASWYGKKFHGRKAANGERYDMNELTAAHKQLPFGTKLLVKNRRTGNTCIVRVNDRGPYHGNRVIDLSMGAAKKLNMLSQGVAMVDVVVLGM